MGVVIKSFGHFIPNKKLKNSELSKRFNVSEEWILDKTGIEERAYFLDGATSDMIVFAVLNCLRKTNLSTKDIDCIIVATMTPDFYCPSTASIVHKKLNTKNACGFDIMAACSGYIYALQLASSLINSKTYKNILVCGSDKMSSCINPNDRKTVLVLADSAGVSLLQYSDAENNIIDTICKLDSEFFLDVNILNGGSQKPLTKENFEENYHFLQFSSKRIFEHGIFLMEKAIKDILEKNSISIDDIDFIIPHQANKRMIEALAKRFSFPINKFIINIEKIGNTSAATIPVAISEAIEIGILKGNEKLLLASVGAGFTYASSLIQL